MNKYSLTVAKRTVAGKKVKKLRKEGILPANIYGKNVASLAVQVPFSEFMKVYNDAGETSLVELSLDEEKRPVLIHNVQLDFLTQQPVHADFFQVNLKEKVRTMVPVLLTGEAKAVLEKVGLLLQTLNEIEVEALPADLPESLEVDVTNLAAVDDQITVADVKKPQGVTVLTEPTQTIAKISELVSEEAQEQAAADAAAAEAAKAEGAEGAAPAEGEAPKTEAAPAAQTEKKE